MHTGANAKAHEYCPVPLVLIWDKKVYRYGSILYTAGEKIIDLLLNTHLNYPYDWRTKNNLETITHNVT